MRLSPYCCRFPKMQKVKFTTPSRWILWIRPLASLPSQDPSAMGPYRRRPSRRFFVFTHEEMKCRQYIRNEMFARPSFSQVAYEPLDMRKSHARARVCIDYTRNVSTLGCMDELDTRSFPIRASRPVAELQGRIRWSRARTRGIDHGWQHAANARVMMLARKGWLIIRRCPCSSHCCLVMFEISDRVNLLQNIADFRKPSDSNK